MQTLRGIFGRTCVAVALRKRATGTGSIFKEVKGNKPSSRIAKEARKSKNYFCMFHNRFGYFVVSGSYISSMRKEATIVRGTTPICFITHSQVFL